MLYDPDNYQDFINDITENGFHIFSREKANSGSYYPPPAYPMQSEIDIAKLNEDDIITIRAFFPVSKTKPPRIDGGMIDLQVETIDLDAAIIFANILTELPEEFALAKNTTIELYPDEILSVQE